MRLNFSQTKTYLYLVLILAIITTIFAQNSSVSADNVWRPGAFPAWYDGTVYWVSGGVKESDANAPSFFGVQLFAIHETTKEAELHATDQMGFMSSMQPGNLVSQIQGKTENGYWTAGIYSLKLGGKDLFVAVVTIQSEGNSNFTISRIYDTQAEAEEGARKLGTQWLGGVIDPCLHYPESCGGSDQMR